MNFDFIWIYCFNIYWNVNVNVIISTENFIKLYFQYPIAIFSTLKFCDDSSSWTKNSSIFSWQIFVVIWALQPYFIVTQNFHIPEEIPIDCLQTPRKNVFLIIRINVFVWPNTPYQKLFSIVESWKMPLGLETAFFRIAQVLGKNKSPTVIRDRVGCQVFSCKLFVDQICW